ncbi:MAG TPA: transposase [Clostridia bacterium]|nr:transposase [Clostridia bacterium]
MIQADEIDSRNKAAPPFGDYVVLVRADDIRPYKERLRTKQRSSNEQVCTDMYLPTRKRNRLEGFDYSSRCAYFITICVAGRYAMLWEQDAEIVRPDQPPLSQYGRIVETAIRQIDGHYGNIVVDTYCIMPDHVHMVVFLFPQDSNQTAYASGERMKNGSSTLPTIIGSFKRWVSRQVGFPIWQKSFHDKILWDHAAYLEVYRYIAENPLHHENDFYV